MRWLHADIRAVFFDAVGTLIFPKPSAPEVYAEVAAKYGLNLTAADVRTRFVAAYRAEEAIDAATGWATSERREHERWHRIVTETLHGMTDPDACFGELFAHFATPSAWAVNPDAATVLTELVRRGLVVGLGSNYDARLWPVLDGFPELRPLRERVVVSATVGYRKPAREFFAEVCRVAGCEPVAVLFVGDDVENDYDGAESAGLVPLLLGTERERRITALGELLRC
jgi:putative hydrolase of the HAD superfamily